MKYHKIIMLKNNRECCLRSGDEKDGPAVLENFSLTHSQTDYLLSYPDENSFDAVEEGRLLERKAESGNEAEIIAAVGDQVAGTAGIEAIGTKYKVRHRARFGISVAKEFWGLGIGRALMNACIECAVNAGYEQLELDVAAENTRAISMYKKAGFVEYGRNPKGFKSRSAGFQELIYMKLDLTGGTSRGTGTGPDYHVRLIQAALDARRLAYAPYSRYRVGAALLTAEGEILQGGNIENASYGATNCAERTVIFRALSEGRRNFCAIAIAGGMEGAEPADYAYPCGICRQVMQEFAGEDFIVIVAKSVTDYKEYRLGDLLPYGFGGESIQ